LAIELMNVVTTDELLQAGASQLRSNDNDVL